MCVMLLDRVELGDDNELGPGRVCKLALGCSWLFSDQLVKKLIKILIFFFFFGHVRHALGPG